MEHVEETKVIREVYSNKYSSENFELELEHALETKVRYIVIEPTKLGEETSRWIRVGNCLHKTCVLSGLAALLLPHLLPDSVPVDFYVSLPAAALSTGCATLYGISWQFDPCCKYQVTTNNQELSKLNVRNLTNPSPVVLVRREDRFRKILHNGIALLCTVFIVKSFENFLHS